jgi:hypothetical protein
MTSFSGTRLVALSLLLSGLLLFAGSAQAQVTKPFKVSGGGLAPDGLSFLTYHWAVGQATHLGQYAGEGNFDIYTLNPPDADHPNSFTGTFGSHDPFVFTAANGDELVCYYGRDDKGADGAGTFELTIVGVTEGGGLIVDAVFIAEFVAQPVESTGRFAGATGGWIMYAETEPFVLGSTDPVEYSWEGEGELTLEKAE